MPVYLVLDGCGSFHGVKQRINLNDRPCPTIKAKGLGAVGGSEYYLEFVPDDYESTAEPLPDPER